MTREYGRCTSCGSDPVEAVGPDRISVCCGSVVHFGAPE